MREKEAAGHTYLYQKRAASRAENVRAPSLSEENLGGAPRPVTPETRGWPGGLEAVSFLGSAGRRQEKQFTVLRW